MIIDDADTIYNDFHTLCFAETLRKHDIHDVEKASMSLLAWTTTPRTIPANIALVANPEIEYTQLYDKEQKEFFVVATSLIHKFYKNADEYVTIRRSK